MKRVLLGLVAGLLIGVLATVYFFGRSGKASLPGTVLRPPDANAANAGSVSVTLEEKFFDALLGTIFQQLGPPQLKLAQLPSAEPTYQTIAFQDACSNVVVLNAESGGVKTGVRFTGGKIVVPLAFTGSYSVLGKCIQFKGTGKANVELSFEQTRQTVFGALIVEEVNLENVPPLISAFVTAFVRQTIAAQVNPFEVLRASQLALSLPIKTTGGSVKANVKDVRSEVQEGALRIVMTYDFSAEKNTG
jgi:hypothetical protein